MTVLCLQWESLYMDRWSLHWYAALISSTHTYMNNTDATINGESLRDVLIEIGKTGSVDFVTQLSHSNDYPWNRRTGDTINCGLVMPYDNIDLGQHRLR